MNQDTKEAVKRAAPEIARGVLAIGQELLDHYDAQGGGSHTMSSDALHKTIDLLVSFVRAALFRGDRSASSNAAPTEPQPSPEAESVPAPPPTEPAAAPEPGESLDGEGF